MMMVKFDNNGNWFALLFIALFFAIVGANSSGLTAMLCFMVAIGLLVAGIGTLEKTVEELAVEEESGAAEEKEAEKEEGLREEEAKFRLNEESGIRKKMAELRKVHLAGKISKRKYQNELDDLKNELEELKTGVELHIPKKTKKTG